MKIRSGGPRSKDRPFTGQEALVLWVILKKGRTYPYELIKNYHFHPQEAYRVLGRLEKRGFTSSEWHGKLHVSKLTEKRKDVAQELASYQPILSSNFEHLKVPSRGKMVNAGGGICEIARLINNKLYHVHFSFLASMAIPPEKIYARAIKGIPLIIFGNEEE